MTVKYIDLPNYAKPHIVVLYQFVVFAPIFTLIIGAAASGFAEQGGLSIPFLPLLLTAACLGLSTTPVVYRRSFKHHSFREEYAPSWSTKWLSFWFSTLGFVSIILLVLLLYLTYIEFNKTY